MIIRDNIFGVIVNKMVKFLLLWGFVICLIMFEDYEEIEIRMIFVMNIEDNLFVILVFWESFIKIIRK